MTLVALHFDGESFNCFSDSRVTQASSLGSGLAVISNEFCKLQILACKVWHENSVVARFDLGVGFAGSTFVAGTAISNAANLLANISSPDGSVPKIDDAVEIFRWIASIIVERLKVAIQEPSTSFLIFGYCPLAKVAKAFQVNLLVGVQPLQFEVTHVPLTVGTVTMIGSGASDLSGILSSSDPSVDSVDFPSLFRRAVVYGLDRGTGGGVQILQVDTSGAQFVPVLQPSSDDDWEDEVNLTMSGIVIDGLSFGGKFKIGDRAIAVGTRMAQNNQWVKRLGYSVHPGKDVTPGFRNLASIHYIMEYQGVVDLRGLVFDIVVEDRPQSEATYEYKCPQCDTVSGFLWSRSGTKVPHSFVNGSFQFICSNCKEPQKVLAENIALKRSDT